MAQWKPGVNFILILSLISFSENGVIYSSETPMALARNLHGFAPFSSFLRMKMSISGHGSLLGHAMSCPPSGSGAKRFTPPSSRKRSLSRATRTPPARESCTGEVSWKVLGDFNQRTCEFNWIHTSYRSFSGQKWDLGKWEVATDKLLMMFVLGSSLGDCPQNLGLLPTSTCLNHPPGPQVGKKKAG